MRLLYKLSRIELIKFSQKLSEYSKEEMEFRAYQNLAGVKDW